MFSSQNANFENIIVPTSTEQNIYVASVLHSATINVNEMGTVAAAATKVELGKSWQN